MSWIEMHLVKEALAELADAGYQTQVWLATEGEVSSPTEAFSQLFDDSGLGDALDSQGTVFDPEIDQRLRSLEELLKKLTAGQRAPRDVLEDGAAATMRSISAHALFALTRHEAKASRRPEH